MLVARYRLDPERSTVSAVLRPQLDTDSAITATIRGEISVVDGDDPALATGTVRIALAAADHEVPFDLPDTHPEIDRGPDGELVLRGSASRPAGSFGITGPPLLNPTLVLRWRAVLVPAD